MNLKSRVSLLALLPFSLLAAPLAVAHCGSGAAPSSPDGGLVGSPPPGDGGTQSTDGGGTTGSGFYSPHGCAYSITELTSRGYTNIALDDTTQPSSAASAAPLRVRVGLRGNVTKGGAGYADPTTTAAFTWETSGATTNARVRYASSPAGLTSSSVPVQTGFVYEVPSAGITGTEPPTYFHEADVCGLTPGTTYYYQVGGGAEEQEIWSATQSFTTVASSGSITVGVFGDARDTVATWQMVNQRMTGAGASLLLVSGDIVDVGVEEDNDWQPWLDAIWTYDAGATGFLTLGQVTIVPIAGNHENEASQFYANWAMPGSSEKYANTYSSFDVGNTHFVMIDDELISAGATGSEASAQLAWIDSDLNAANADRANHPFIVAISHRGMFSTSYHAVDSDVLATRAAIAPLYDKYHVDLALNGHDHEYERSKELNVGSPASGAPNIVDGGTTYVINAGAGADPYPVGSTPASFSLKSQALAPESSSPYVGCYVLLTLSGSTMTLNAYGMNASGGSTAGDTVIDTVVFQH
jgi:hypothetical protein